MITIAFSALILFTGIIHSSETDEIIVYLPSQTQQLTEANSQGVQENNQTIPSSLLKHLQNSNNQNFIDSVLLNIATQETSNFDLHKSIMQVDSACMKTSEHASYHLVQSVKEKHKNALHLYATRIKEINKQIDELTQAAEAEQSALDRQTLEYYETLTILKSWHTEAVPSPLIKPVIIKASNPMVTKDPKGTILYDGMPAI